MNRCRPGNPTMLFCDAALALCAVLLSACESPNDSRGLNQLPTGALAYADSGRTRDPLGVSVWRSVVVNGRVRAIQEDVALYGAWIGWRRYDFDAQGVLRHYEEWVAQHSTRVSTDSTMAVGEARESSIDFAEDWPMLSMRKVADRSMPFQRIEMKRIHARGYALLDSATRPDAR